MLRIVTYPHPALRFVSKPVEQIDATLRTQVRDMFDLMYAARGIGLAANQVGIPRQFFILNLTADPERKDQELVFLNPQIVKRHGGLDEEEGCLSLPGLYAPVHRAKRIRVKAFGLDGGDIDMDAEDLLSRAIQHELDHLNGKLFIDYLEGKARETAQPKIQEIETAFRSAQAAGAYPPDDEIGRQLQAMARGEPVVA